MKRDNPRVIRASHCMLCDETGWTIQAGEECLFYPARISEGRGRIYHMESETAEHFTEAFHYSPDRESFP